jgi:hypothetical protein
MFQWVTYSCVSRILLGRKPHAGIDHETECNKEQHGRDEMQAQREPESTKEVNLRHVWPVRVGATVVSKVGRNGGSEC